MLRREKLEEVSDDLYALSCGPDLRVRIFSACVVNGVRFNTVEREKYCKTQNSGIMTEGTHNGELIEFYGALKEILELQYNSNLQVNRSVVLFRCDWFDMGGKKTGIRDDGYFKSVNIERLWYKNDAFILSTQSRKIFYLQDTKEGKNWRVVQKFEHRNHFNVAEKDITNDHVAAYQEDTCSDIEYIVQDINPLLHTIRREGEEGSTIDASIVNSEKNSRDDPEQDNGNESDEDDTWHQYCSDNEQVEIPTGESDDE